MKIFSLPLPENVLLWHWRCFPQRQLALPHDSHLVCASLMVLTWGLCHLVSEGRVNEVSKRTCWQLANDHVRMPRGLCVWEYEHKHNSSERWSYESVC